MDTYKWLNHVFSGRIFQLGRLQYLIHQPTAAIPGVGDGEWILGIHIPEGGGLGTAVVAQSLALARPFFAEHFADKPVTHGQLRVVAAGPLPGRTFGARHPTLPRSQPCSPPTANPAMNPPMPSTSPSAPAAWKTWIHCPGRRRCKGLSWSASTPAAPGSWASGPGTAPLACAAGSPANRLAARSAAVNLIVGVLPLPEHSFRR